MTSKQKEQKTTTHQCQRGHWSVEQGWQPCQNNAYIYTTPTNEIVWLCEQHAKRKA